MTLDTMLLVSQSIALSLGLCAPPDQMGAKLYYFRSVSGICKCLDIPTLLGTTSKFPRLQTRNLTKTKKQGTDKIPSVAGLLFKDLDFLDFLCF